MNVPEMKEKLKKETERHKATIDDFLSNSTLDQFIKDMEKKKKEMKDDNALLPGKQDREADKRGSTDEQKGTSQVAS